MLIKRKKLKQIITQIQTTKIGCVVTCHNYGSYLKDCIDSLLNQTLKFEQIIIILDNCSDNSKSIVLQYKDIEFYEIILGSGGESFNFGVEKLNDNIKYIVHVDADNKLHNEFNEFAIKNFKDPTIGLVYPHVISIDKNNNIIGNGADHEFDINILRRNNFIDTCTIIRQEAFIPWDKFRFLDDWNFNLKLFHNGWKFSYQPEAKFYYRLHEMQISHEVNKNMKISRLYVHKNSFRTTIVTAFAGREYMLDKYFEKLNGFDNLEQFNLIAINTSSDLSFTNKLKYKLNNCKLKSYLYLEHIINPKGMKASDFTNSAEMRIQYEVETNLIVAEIYNLARNNISNCDFVLFWEDDIIFEKDDLDKLLSEMNINVDVIGGLVRQRFGGGNTEFELNSNSKMIPVKRKSGIYPVHATGFGMTLFRVEVINNIRFRVKDELKYFDWSYGQDCKDFGYYWFAHGDVVCKHYSKDGSYV